MQDLAKRAKMCSLRVAPSARFPHKPIEWLVPASGQLLVSTCHAFSANPCHNKNVVQQTE